MSNKIIILFFILLIFLLTIGGCKLARNPELDIAYKINKDIKKHYGDNPHINDTIKKLNDSLNLIESVS